VPVIHLDNQPIEFHPGERVIDAARRAGIDIPSLCYFEEVEPSTSCLVCLVKDEATGRLLPSCGVFAEEGQRFASETDEVRAARRSAIELLLSDHVGDCVAPCQFACPVHIDLPAMLRRIGADDHRAAIEIIKEDLALPATLGRVCNKPCESGCRRGGVDSPVTVCDLKRQVADADLASLTPYLPTPRPDTGKRVTIVGGGPTGLSAAYHLRLSGHAVTLLERRDALGGRLLDEPEDRLPRKVLLAEIAQMLSLGVAPKLGCESAIHLEPLAGEADAILLAMGKIDADSIASLGLKSGKRGVCVNEHSFETSLEGVFAAGQAVRGGGPIVRSVADGKLAAESIDQFLRGQTPHVESHPFSVRMGKLGEEETQRFYEVAVGKAEGGGRKAEIEVQRESATGHELSDFRLPTSDFALAASRCLACGCTAHGSCALEKYAIEYGAQAKRFGSTRREYQAQVAAGVIYEPGKCIACEVCAKIAAAAGEPLGLTLVGRGFNVRVGVPLNKSLAEALTEVAEKCVAACPTGALTSKRKA